MHVLRTGVPRCLGVARSASSPKAAQALGCSLTPGLRISVGRVTCMARAASVPGLCTLGFLLLCGACVGVWVVLGFGFRMCPATPGWVVGVCVRLCARSACTPPLLAGLCSVGVSAWARVSAAPHHSWLGCAVLVWVLGLGFRLRPATPGWGVRCGCGCLGSGFGCAPPLLAGLLGCTCLCAHSACTPPLLAGLCVLGLGFWLRRATPGWGVGPCVLLCALRLYPATPGSGVRCRCACSGSGFSCAGSLLARLLGFLCVCLRAPLVPRHCRLGCAVWACVVGSGLQLRPATPG